jgi:hypothetical protein
MLEQLAVGVVVDSLGGEPMSGWNEADFAGWQGRIHERGEMGVIVTAAAQPAGSADSIRLSRSR